MVSLGRSLLIGSGLNWKTTQQTYHECFITVKSSDEHVTIPESVYRLSSCSSAEGPDVLSELTEVSLHVLLKHLEIIDRSEGSLSHFTDTGRVVFGQLTVLSWCRWALLCLAPFPPSHCPPDAYLQECSVTKLFLEKAA